MALESVNNMHVVTIQEKDQKIKDLMDQLAQANANGGGKMSKETESHYLEVLKQNQELRNQID